MNGALDTLGIPKLTNQQAQKPALVHSKIKMISKKVCDLLKVEDPPASVGDKMLEQFENEFGDQSKDDQYRILTSMPKEEFREALQRRF